ncbi:MAG: polymer-forming cytoskeletal protein [Desulfobacterales bacterium]|nr:polymer-forming cytoskeletal protein [Desulfobacterales bacterium]
MNLKNQQGAILITIIVSMVAAAAIGAGLVSLTTTSTYGQLGAMHQDRAYYLAEAGGRYAVPLVKTDIENSQTTNINQLHNQTFTFDSASATNGKFLIEVDTASDPDNVFVHATGIAGLSLEARVRITSRLARTQDSPFKYGSFGDSKIKLEDDARITGDVGTNAASSKIDIQDDAVVTGTQTANAGMTLTAPTFPAGSYTSDLTSSTTLSAGTYNYDDVTLNNNDTVTISGNVTINVNDEFKMENNAKIIILANSSLTVYANDDVKIEDNSEINKNGAAQNFVLYLCRNKDLKIKDNAIVNGGFYAPSSSKVEIKDNAQVTGSVVAKEVEMEDDAQITHDPSLLNVQTPGGGSPTLGDQVRYYS